MPSRCSTYYFENRSNYFKNLPAGYLKYLFLVATENVILTLIIHCDVQILIRPVIKFSSKFSALSGKLLKFDYQTDKWECIYGFTYIRKKWYICAKKMRRAFQKLEQSLRKPAAVVSFEIRNHFRFRWPTIPFDL